MTHRPLKIGSFLIYYDPSGGVRRAIVTEVHSPQCADIRVSRQAPHRDYDVKRVPIVDERRSGCAKRGGLLEQMREGFL